MRSAIIIICIALFCCGRAMAQEIEQRNIQPFKNLVLSGLVEVYYTQSDTFSLKVEAALGQHKNVETLQSDDQLTIRSKSGGYGAKIYVSGNHLEEVHVSGSSSFRTKGALNMESILFDVSGASNVKAKIHANSVNAGTSGASGLTLEGTAKHLIAQTSGASWIRAYNLLANETEVTASGASSAQVYADKKISANASGASNIKFRGDPKEVTAEATMSSAVVRIVNNGEKDQQRESIRRTESIGSTDGNLGIATNGGDTTIYNTRGRKIIVIEKDDKSGKHYHMFRTKNYRHWTGFMVGFNGYVTPSGKTNLPSSQEYMRLDYSKSFNLQLNVFQHNFHLYKNYLNLITGLGFQWTQYQFSNATTLNADSSYTSGTIDSSKTRNYDKNRLKASFITIPLLLEYNSNNSNPRKSFHVAAGVIAGYKLSSKTKQTYEVNGYNSKVVRKDDYNMNPFRINAHASFGYSNWTLFGEYALSQLFEGGRGPELYPFTIGLRIIPF